MKIKITDQVDNFKPGDTPDVPTHYGEALIKLGVAQRMGGEKSAPAPENKMADAPANKASRGRGRSAAS